ncbi:MAG: hypothetical protein ABS63_01790 [Microbacterium sp. SCN 70-27]|uniref:DUF6541 family protein n=1 Tax=unclassified Microbacterium TaxID=2609290 RepID=UPI00086E7653|nr:MULTISPECIES: DUF6541 family protein [unclassified Microbacterium]MBN9225383.1 hypothetical protein [Microbacterium sp.]ODT29022.1 MAG: hypothetical protein ABS63_01790 [Microbacterium sp. SCN 70-27]
MSADWLSAAPAFLVACGYILVPGLLVRLAGWNPRSIGPYLLIPAFSTAIVAVASNLAPLIGLKWSALPVALVTAVAAAVAWLLRRWVGHESIPRPSRTVVLAACGGVILAAVVLLLQLTYVFVGHGNISQTFDNIVHLNSIRMALDAGDASALQIGRTSDIGFYPNAWHSYVTLAAQATGASVPVAVNAANLAIGAVVWPVSCMALAAAFFRGRSAALIGSAALSTAFGAFPILLMSFGVLYPNATGYAVLPAGLAAVWWLLGSRGPAQIARASIALAVACGAIGLGHPNAFLALFALGAALTGAELLRRAVTRRSRRDWVLLSVTAGVLLVVGAGLWRVGRTGSAMSQWGPWTGTADAVVQGVLLSPRSMPVTVVTAILVVIGIVAACARPRRLPLLAPLAVTLLLFVAVSGTPYNFIRDALTNPWYNDSNRLAALLPIAGIPVAVLGVLTVTDAAAWVFRRVSLPAVARGCVAAVAAVGLFVVGAGPNATASATAARGSYELTDTSALLTSDELALLDRLDETVPEDALILGNPWTGASLALAIGDRQVVERHIFGERTADEAYLDEHLGEIGADPRVCATIDRVGVTYVLDFGSQNVFNDPAQGLDRRGLDDLVASDHLVLVDSEGDSARLFRVEGC